MGMLRYSGSSSESLPFFYLRHLTEDSLGHSFWFQFDLLRLGRKKRSSTKHWLYLATRETQNIKMLASFLQMPFACCFLIGQYLLMSRNFLAKNSDQVLVTVPLRFHKIFFGDPLSIFFLVFVRKITEKSHIPIMLCRFFIQSNIKLSLNEEIEKYMPSQ